MSQHLLDYFGMDALGLEAGRKGKPKIMEPDVGKVGLPEQWLPGAVDQVMAFDWCTCPGREDPLPLPLVPLQCPYGGFGQLDAPLAL